MTYSEKLKKVFNRYAKGLIGIKHEKLTNKKKEAISANPCTSRIGGKPAVPKDFKWPYYNAGKDKNFPLAFIMQVNLKDVKKSDTDNLLPKKGVLSFFYDLSFRSAYCKGSARVYYFSDENGLKLQKPPKDLKKAYVIPDIPISFKKAVHAPWSKTWRLNFGKSYDKHFAALAKSNGYEAKDWYGDALLNPFGEEVFGRGAYEAEMGMTGKEKLDKSAEKKAKREWLNLMKFGGLHKDYMIENYGKKFQLFFGRDPGNLFYWIKKKDLANCNFDNIWAYSHT